MKPISVLSLPGLAGLLCLSGAVVSAQAPKPTADPPKPPVHKPEQSNLNRLKQDDRSKKQLSDAVEKLREAAKRNEAADKELKRVNANDLKEDPAKVIESMKDKLSPEDTAKLKELLEKSKDVINSDEAKKMLEEAKKKAAESIKPKSAATTTPPEKFGPSTFDQVPAPTAAPIQPEAPKKRTPGFFVTGKDVIFPLSKDPANPKRTLPPSDPRTRTYLVTGNGQVKTPTMVLEADRIEMIASQGGGNEGLGGLTSKKPAKTAKANSVDPVQPGINADPAEEKKSTPFERVIATGRVNIVKIENGKTQAGKGGSMIYDKKSGNMILTDWPEAQVEGKLIVGNQKDAKIILVPDGQPRVENCSIRGFDEAKPTASAAPAAPRAQIVR